MGIGNLAGKVFRCGSVDNAELPVGKRFHNAVVYLIYKIPVPEQVGALSFLAERDQNTGIADVFSQDGQRIQIIPENFYVYLGADCNRKAVNPAETTGGAK